MHVKQLQRHGLLEVMAPLIQSLVDSVCFHFAVLCLSRYVYAPLGGGKHYMRNFLIVFTFVAIWHDISLKLLAWGWLITLFIVPEVLGKRMSSHVCFPIRLTGR